MSYYDYEKVPFNTTITRHQKSKLESYCKVKGISRSMLVRLFIDELRIEQIDTSIRRHVEDNAFKIEAILGNQSNERREESYNDENGKRKTVWFSKRFFK